MTHQNRLKGYNLVFSREAQRVLDRLERPVAEKIGQKLRDLIDGEQNLDIKKLQDQAEPRYRLRVGDMRVIYTVWHHKVIVYIITMGHRREIYD